MFAPPCELNGTLITGAVYGLQFFYKDMLLRRAYQFINDLEIFCERFMNLSPFCINYTLLCLMHCELCTRKLKKCCEVESTVNGHLQVTENSMAPVHHCHLRRKTAINELLSILPCIQKRSSRMLFRNERSEYICISVNRATGPIFIIFIIFVISHFAGILAFIH